MFDVDPEKLIKAIKTRPALYNKNDKLYHSHRKHKEKIWREICEEIHGNWNQLNQLHKIEYVREIQKRWKSLRTCFTRELALQKKENIKRESDQHVKRRKRYEYFNNLLFLMDSTDGTEEARDSDDSADPLDNSYQPEEIIYDYGESSSDVKNIQRMKIENPSEQQYPQTQIVYERSNTLEEKIIDMLKDIKKDEDDEDRQFMLSLVPSFRKLNAKQKLTARIEMLKVLQSITFEQD
nr:uncharacterized protein LOC113394804 [Vanessa tameamea]